MKIDATRNITKVIMQITNGHINKFNTVDSNGEDVVNFGKFNNSSKEQFTCNIPKGKEIIGMYTSLNK